jgi:hypothetical protein
MDLEDDTHMNTHIGTTTVQEVINVPVMLSPEIYNQIAEMVIKKLEANPGYSNLIYTKIEDWMSRNFDLSDYNYENIKEDILDSVRYDLKNSIRAEVEIYVD